MIAVVKYGFRTLTPLERTSIAGRLVHPNPVQRPQDQELVFPLNLMTRSNVDVEIFPSDTSPQPSVEAKYVFHRSLGALDFRSPAWIWNLQPDRHASIRPSLYVARFYCKPEEDENVLPTIIYYCIQVK